MGCTQSKIENEESVTRCKERKLFMKEAVAARNAFAAAHSAYVMSLKNTGAALSDYAHGEVEFTSTASSSVPPSVAGVTLSPVPQPPSYETLPPPPPPLPDFTPPPDSDDFTPPPPPLQRAATMPEFIPKPVSIKNSEPDPIIEEDNEEEELEVESHNLRHRSTRSSGGSRSGISGREQDEDLQRKKPPSPPRQQLQRQRDPIPQPPPESNTWDFFFESSVPMSSLADIDETGIEQKAYEERSKTTRVYKAKSSKTEPVVIMETMPEIQTQVLADMDETGIEQKMYEERSKTTTRIYKAKSSKNEPVVIMETMPEIQTQSQQPVAPPPPPAAAKQAKKTKNLAAGEGKRSGKGINLFQVFTELDDCFLKASQSAHEVSKMLEANRLHYHSNFADNRGHIDHSARVMRVITWNRSFKAGSGLPVDQGKDEFDSEENETHATVLDKMLAWEKKLYDEVKTGELMKMEYQRKVSSLTKLKKRGSNTEALERTKAAVSHLHTRYIVDMQSMDSTVSEINRLRDQQLYPKLVAVVDAMATMWETMRNQHENQTKILRAMRSVDISFSSKETTKHHHDRTIQLWNVVRDWHSVFTKLMTHQKEYIKALNSWLKLNLIPMDHNLKEKVSSPQRPENPPIQTLLRAWQEHLEKLPEEVARTAIYNFTAVIDTIVQYQVDEIKLMASCEQTRNELKRTTRKFEEWQKKYMQKRTPPDEMDPDRAQDTDLVADKRVQVEALQKRLEEEEDTYHAQCIQVREKSLMTLKTRLPELFHAMSEFSLACSDMYRSLSTVSRRSNPNNDA